MSRSLVTGAHGFVASHLVRALLERGDEVRVLDRPDPRAADVGGPRRSGLDLLGLRDEVELAEGDLRDAEAVAARGRRLRLGLPPGRADDRRRRPRIAAGDARSQRARRLERLRGLPRARRRAGRLRLLRQGLRVQPRAALPRGLPAARRLPLRRQQGRRRHRRPQLRQRLRPAARGHPLRQHLRRRRPQLLPPDPGDDDRRARRPSAGDPLRRQPRARLPPRRRRRLRLPGDRRGARPGEAPRRGLQRRRRAPALGARGGRPDRCRWPAPASSPNTSARAPPTARSTASTSTRPSCAS